MEKDEKKILMCFRELDEKNQKVALEYVRKLLLSQNEVYDDSPLVSDLNISSRLRNILTHYGCERLGDITQYTKDSIIRFRNLGNGTRNELYALCESHGIKLYGCEDLSDKEIGVSISDYQYRDLYDMGIRNKDDVRKISMDDIKFLASDDKNLYNKLRKLKNNL